MWSFVRRKPRVSTTPPSPKCVCVRANAVGSLFGMVVRVLMIKSLSVRPPLLEIIHVLDPETMELGAAWFHVLEDARVEALCGIFKGRNGASIRPAPSSSNRHPVGGPRRCLVRVSSPPCRVYFAFAHVLSLSLSLSRSLLLSILERSAHTPACMVVCVLDSAVHLETTTRRRWWSFFSNERPQATRRRRHAKAFPSSSPVPV